MLVIITRSDQLRKKLEKSFILDYNFRLRLLYEIKGMSRFIKRLEAIGIHGRFDINLDFQDGVNIIHGSNGTGKTTVLHILANAVNEDFRRFGYLKFQKLTITLDDDTEILIEQQNSPQEPRQTVTTVFVNNQKADFYRFAELLEEEKQKENSEILLPARYYPSSSKKKQDIDLKATYFPAFRTMIEAWATLDENEIRHFARRSPNFSKVLRSSARSTELARILFGKFVPRLEYPSPIEIEEHINSELTEAQLKIASLDRNLLSQAFIQFSQAISQSSETDDNTKEPEEVITEITELSEKLQNSPFQGNHDQSGNVYKKLIERLTSFESDPKSKTIASRVLSVYKSSLQQRLDAQIKAYSSIERYLESVNGFLERKQLKIGSTNSPQGRGKLGVKIGDEEDIHSLQILSSGERQVVGLIYAASHMTGGRVVLIDEPEISLHIDWQRKLLPEMVKQLDEKQLIICTHSAVIASKYRERMIKLELQPTANANINTDTLGSEDQIYILDDDLEDIDIPF
ncbi:MAG: AAA family ATPase [Microcystis sp. M54BS1]|uniref:AAA family ATPase n=2 Tax=unclassified Microcystis TaxID=2643300 RepID=UPI00257F1006|nr:MULTISPECIES: AAA family ATPase [unclassified Microcystis]MCA2524238.1 AAA family ATPase [Microcystis sp. M61BS1]MCA2536887.1 AAA family ATPase [Microcystis sp. M57BS1]MCA2540366.1 AAA family ATPase [Microcystis sp. M54BS1]MCA2593887.1 AAA family ATPase [Microcystis sp. M38BS1]MCA2606461.1 AAA family ATPase [Microcystis sp. M26BS1]MCA2610677.1 AAA family ATPase [Microcystis sp. M27BS1]MCA2614471.1 AAA family ATPase [Microcystis sp. M25BS1]MCA2639241.1 AAA family ATPase [Microcystis sp. M